MISIENKFLFIHVPKTGGNSVQNVIKDVSEDDIVILQSHQDGLERFEVRNKKFNITKHSTFNDYKAQIPTQIFEELYKFAVIRNPWDRLISFYFSPHRNVKSWSRESFIKLVADVEPVRFYVCDRTSEKGQLDGSLNFLARFETLKSDLAEIGGELGVDFSDLPHRNQSGKAHYRNYYDDELAELVFEKYREEIEFCGYDF